MKKIIYINVIIFLSLYGTIQSAEASSVETKLNFKRNLTDPYGVVDPFSKNKLIEEKPYRLCSFTSEMLDPLNTEVDSRFECFFQDADEIIPWSAEREIFDLTDQKCLVTQAKEVIPRAFHPKESEEFIKGTSTKPYHEVAHIVGADQLFGAIGELDRTIYRNVTDGIDGMKFLGLLDCRSCFDSSGSLRKDMIPTVVGAMAFSIDNQGEDILHVNIHFFGISPYCQRMGHGKRLMKGFEEAMIIRNRTLFPWLDKADKFKSIVFTLEAKNKESENYWKRHGYKCTENSTTKSEMEKKLAFTRSY